MTAFDFIVVGAGSAGCALAARLAERGHAVLLLEAGKADRNPWIHVPLGVGKLLNDEEVYNNIRDASILAKDLFYTLKMDPSKLLFRPKQ